MDLSKGTLDVLYQQRTELIESSDDEWKKTVFYQERLNEINRCINKLN